MKKFFAVILMWVSCAVQADGLAGLSYTTYAGTGATPNLNPPAYSSPLTTGQVSTVNFNWGSGNVLDTARADQVIVHFTGYFMPTASGTYQFGTTTDDGSMLTINGTTVVNAWREQGPTFWSGSVALTAGQAVPLDFWYYENGGGAVAQLYWVNPASGNWEIVPTKSLATTPTYWAPSLCCGGSSAVFNASPTNLNLVNSFVARTTNDSQVYIQQVGNSNTITVTQEGTKNNYTYISNSGLDNNISINQLGNASTTANYSYSIVNGNNNTVTVAQSGTGGTKGAFITVQNNNNSVNLSQADSGSHYAEIGISGGNKTVNVNQSGAANHMASIQLSGNPVSLTLQQLGSTQNFYSIQFNCATAGGCSPISVKQGQ